MSEVLAAPERGFTRAEFERRTAAVQRAMGEAQIDALLLTTEPQVRYFSGFHSQFWESPTRPWFLVLPAEGKPIAVIPAIGAAGMAATWVEDIRTWPAPQPADDGLSLLSACLKEQSRRSGRIGVPMGHETHVRMPAADFARLRDDLGNLETIDCAPLLRRQLNVKSPAEIEKIRFACQITSQGFIALPEVLAIGQSERDACRALRQDLLNRGADSTAFMVAGSGPGGYDNIIMGPTDRALSLGDVLIIDTGTVFDGYFCDFDRNFAFGPPDDQLRRANDCVHQAAEAGIRAARPGVTMEQLWQTMWPVLEAGGALGNDVGRMGHGLGMQLTEGPSIMPGDETVLVPGMVITIEPGMEFAPGKLMVHEENIVITEDGCDLLSVRAGPEMPVVG